MDDRSDVGWPFEKVTEAWLSGTNLACSRTKRMVNFQECFSAKLTGQREHLQRNHPDAVISPVTTPSPTIAFESKTSLPSPSCNRHADYLVDHHDGEAASRNHEEPHGNAVAVTTSASCSSTVPGPRLTSAPRLSFGDGTTGAAVFLGSASAPASTSSTSASKDHDSADLTSGSMSKLSLSSPSRTNWTWPAPSACSDDDSPATNEHRWRWHVASEVGHKWIPFSEQASRQLQRVLSHWESRSDHTSTLWLERSDQQLSHMWTDLEGHGHSVEGVCFDGRHGGLMQVLFFSFPRSIFFVEQNTSRVRYVKIIC